MNAGLRRNALAAHWAGLRYRDVASPGFAVLFPPPTAPRPGRLPRVQAQVPGQARRAPLLA